MTAESDIAAVDSGGGNTAAEVRTALTSVLARADGLAAVSLVDTASQTSENTGDGDVSLTLPTGIAADDLTLIIGISRNSFLTGPNDTGWVKMLQGAVNIGGQVPLGGGNDDTFGIWAKRATGAQTSVNFTVDDTGTDGQVWLMATVRGATGIQAISHHHLSDLIAPSVIGTNGGLLLAFFASHFETGTWDSAPSGMTSQESAVTSTSNVRGLLATQAISENGQVGTREAGSTSMADFISVGLISVF